MSRRRRTRSSAGLSPMGQVSAAGLFLLGLVIGLLGALYYAWVAAPVVYTDASPARFSERYKAEYIHLISESYAANGDWEQANARLAALNDEALPQRVNDLLEMYLREQRPAAEVEHLAQLAQQVGAEGAAVALFAPNPAVLATDTTTLAATVPPATVPPSATPTVTAVPTITPRPTLTPTPTTAPSSTPPPVYRLLSQERVCEVKTAVHRIEVITLDAQLNQLPGTEVWVTWDGGRDRFYTGFKPADGAGYGDFTMTPGVSYAITLAEGSPEISGLRIEPCPNGQDGGWRLTFQNLQTTNKEEGTVNSEQ